MTTRSGNGHRAGGRDALGRFCHFYETRDDLLQTLLPFFKAGLESGEFCAWVVSEPLTETEVWHALDEAVPGLSRYVSDDSIEVLNARDVYLAGGEIDLHRIIGNWSAKLERALSRGYQGIRVSGNTAWLEQKQWREFMEHEAELNRGIHDHPMLVLCTYRSRLRRVGVPRRHGHAPFAVAKRRRWEVVDAPARTKRKAEAIEPGLGEVDHAAGGADGPETGLVRRRKRRRRWRTCGSAPSASRSKSRWRRGNQPLTAIHTNATGSLRWLDRRRRSTNHGSDAARDPTPNGCGRDRARALVKVRRQRTPVVN
jgi:hypothetical protein